MVDAIGPQGHAEGLVSTPGTTVTRPANPTLMDALVVLYNLEWSGAPLSAVANAIMVDDNQAAALGIARRLVAAKYAEWCTPEGETMKRPSDRIRLTANGTRRYFLWRQMMLDSGTAVTDALPAPTNRCPNCGWLSEE